MGVSELHACHLAWRLVASGSVTGPPPRCSQPAVRPTGLLDPSHAEWRTSSLSASANCVEVAFLDGARHVAIRNSKDRQGPVLVFSAEEWRDFLNRVRRNEVGPGDAA
jgi:Domain of unknown function (DUF397)